MSATHVGITGTRNGMTGEQWESLATLLGATPGLVLHHGDCVGVDAEAAHLAEELGAKTEVHPPEDSRLRAYCSGDIVHAVRPYLERNRLIVEQCHLLIGVPAEMEEQPSGGTWYTIRYARSVHRRTFVIFPDGSVER